MEKIGDIIGALHNNINTVLRDSPDQRQRQERITEVRFGRPKSYHVFVKTLSQISEEERRITRFGTMPLLWQEIPTRPDLEGHVGNADDPGDGKVYSEQDIQKAGSVLKAFHDAWHEATIKADSADAVAPETLRRVRKLTDMARICLILRATKLERLLDCICEHSKDDRHLPFERTMLERILGPEDAPHASTFVAEQYRAICRTWNDGDHLEIPEEEPLPLEHIDKYGNGSYGTVTKTRHAFTGMYYARKEHTSPEGSEHFRREISRLKTLSHRHIVRFVKSYQRGNKYGILLKPAATTDLHKLLRRYSRNGLDYGKDNTDYQRDRKTLKPIILTAFGCLSRGLAHIHGCSNIRHKDIKPSNILYQKAFAGYPARFLWADFGIAYDSGHHPDYSKTTSKSRLTPRYAAPEIFEEIQARRPRGGFDLNHSDNSDTINNLPSQEPNSAQRSAIGHGRSSDIYSLGIVFFEILSYLNAEGPEYENTVPGDFEACMPIWENIPATQEWAQIEAQKLKSKNPKNPLIFPFQLGSQMISHAPEARPSISQIVSRLEEASPAYFCTTCQQGHEQYDLQQADALVKEVGFDREADQGGEYEEDSLEHSHYMRRKPGSNEGRSTVTSRGSEYDYDEVLPDTEDGNNNDLTSLLSIQSFADSGLEDSHYMQRKPESNEGGSTVTLRSSEHDYDEVLPDTEDGNNNDLASLLSIQSFADSGLEGSHYMPRKPESNEGGSLVISRSSEYNYDEVLPDAEDGNNDDLISLLSIPSFDSGYGSLNDSELRDEADELTLLLLDDHQLQKLFTIIFRRSKAQERFVSKFRMLLKVFGTELKAEALDASHEAAAELPKVRATYIANEIKERYMSNKAIDETPDGERSARVATSLMKRLEFRQPYLDSAVTDQRDYESDSEASNDIDGAIDEHPDYESDSEVSNDIDDAIDERPTHDQLPKVSLDKVKEFMICSRAFANLQNALRRMVYPDPLIAINDKISNAYELCPGKVYAVFNVHLDINNYLSSELSYQRSLQERSDLLGSVLTISGTASKAFATTAANYMRWKWPQSNFELLETIECSVRGRCSSKLI